MDDDFRDGRITYDEFVTACEKFLCLARKNNDPWRAEGDPKVIGDYFITVTYTQRNPTLYERTDANLTVGIPLIQCRYDVLYNISHSTPVLYFLVSRSCGSSLTLDEIWGLFSSTTGGRKYDMWDIVSQQDHPVLHTPFFYVHPCHNFKLLSECYKGKVHTSEEYLISWLSIVGNAFGLRLSYKYATPSLNDNS